MKEGGQAYQMLQDRPLDEKIQALTRQQVSSSAFFNKKEALIVTSLSLISTTQVKVMFSSLSTALLQVLLQPNNS